MLRLGRRAAFGAYLAAACAASTVAASNNPAPSSAPAPCAIRKAALDSQECANWLSFEATREATQWARVQAIIAALGLAGLISTVAAALRANAVARRSNEDQLRAWIKVTPAISGNLVRSDDGCSLSVEIEAENVGGSPAKDVQIFASMYAKGDIGPEIERFVQNMTLGHGSEYPTTLFPDEATSRELRVAVAEFGVRQNVDTLMLTLIVGTRYRTVFDRSAQLPRVTVRAYDLSNDGSGLVNVYRGAGPESLTISPNILAPGVVT